MLALVESCKFLVSIEIIIGRGSLADNTPEIGQVSNFFSSAATGGPGQTLAHYSADMISLRFFSTMDRYFSNCILRCLKMLCVNFFFVLPFGFGWKQARN